MKRAFRVRFVQWIFPVLLFLALFVPLNRALTPISIPAWEGPPPDPTFGAPHWGPKWFQNLAELHFLDPSWGAKWFGPNFPAMGRLWPALGRPWPALAGPGLALNGPGQPWPCPGRPWPALAGPGHQCPAMFFLVCRRSQTVQASLVWSCTAMAGHGQPWSDFSSLHTKNKKTKTKKQVNKKQTRTMMYQTSP